MLSDGQQSLFYFALAAAVFDLERDAVATKIKGFRGEELRIPALSIFGIENARLSRASIVSRPPLMRS
ncbi:hypothetical protein [Bradyrhizobium australafricanum]|uniref:hypothetical protein n=1 Tax=Bradyrhizobium australafricanum TaxID=2821406 RepID=UPI001CE26347|nr:hypothetical protein [Bradyrhizobium australafricanum]MCA6100069.1 hypothetical protein [Bradyrhizobium australafricanum]